MDVFVDIHLNILLHHNEIKKSKVVSFDQVKSI